MSDERKGLDPDLFHDDEMRRVRARLHKLADIQQGHALFIEGHKIEIARTFSDLRELRAMMGLYVTQHQMAAEKLVLDTRLKTIEDGQKKINDNVTWLVRLVFGVLVVAVLGLILQTKAKASQNDDRTRPAVHVPGNVLAPPAGNGYRAGPRDAPRDRQSGIKVPAS